MFVNKVTRYKIQFNNVSVYIVYCTVELKNIELVKVDIISIVVEY